MNAKQTLESSLEYLKNEKSQCEEKIQHSKTAIDRNKSKICELNRDIINVENTLLLMRNNDLSI